MANLEAHLRGLQEELSNVKALIDHIGWSELMEFAKEQVALRTPGVLGRMDTLFELSGQEFDKGEISGIHLFCNLPAVRVESLEQDILGIEEELGYDRSEHTDNGNNGGSSSVSRRTGSDGGEFEPPT